MSALRDLPAEQLAPFDAPTARDTETVREAIEQNRRRLNDATPVRPFKSTGAEL